MKFNKSGIFLGCIFFVIFVFNQRNSLSVQPNFNGIKNTITADYKQFYLANNLKNLAIGMGIAGVLANTVVDGKIQTWYQESTKNEDTDRIAKAVKPFGNGRITIPVFLGFALIGELTKTTSIGSAAGEWGKRSLRAILVGIPPLLLLQNILGASRPTESNSYWRPFNDDNAVSGHSFMGAVPFLSVAMMVNNVFLKYCFYFGSTLTGLSRINDNAHYFSQTALGWWLSYLATRVVDKVTRQNIAFMPVVIGGYVGVQGVVRF